MSSRSSRHSSGSASTNNRNTHRQNAFEALTGERAPSNLASSRSSRAESDSSRSWHRHRGEYENLDDEIHPEDSISVVMGGGSRASPAPSNASSRHSHRSSDHHGSTASHSSHRSRAHSSSSRSSRRPSDSGSRAESRSSRYCSCHSCSRDQDDDDGDRYTFRHRDSVPHIREQRGRRESSDKRPSLDTAMRNLNLSEESDPETPCALTKYNPKPPSRTGSTSSSSHSRHSSSSSSHSKSRPPTSYTSQSRSRHRNSDIPEESEGEEQLYTPKFSSSHYNNGGDPTAPPTYYSQTAAVNYRQTDNTAPGVTRSRSATYTATRGIAISRRPGDGRLQAERSSNRRGGDGRDGDVPRWLSWFAGA